LWDENIGSQFTFNFSFDDGSMYQFSGGDQVVIKRYCNGSVIVVTIVYSQKFSEWYVLRFSFMSRFLRRLLLIKIRLAASCSCT